MHPDLQRVFDYLKWKLNAEVVVIGSAVKDYETANDVDILLPHAIEWHYAMKRLGTKYNGWDTPQGHLRRANIRVPGVRKRVQILQVSSVPTAHDHPNAALLPDGTILKPGHFFHKHA